MKRKSLTISLILLLAFYPANLPQALEDAAATLYVYPSEVAGLNVGDTFKINITVSNVADLYGWQFKLTYLNDALNASSISEGPFLKKDGASTFFWLAEFTDDYNATNGLIVAACTRSGVESGVDGSGTLATIVFRVKAPISTLLHLFDTKIIDSTSPFGKPIPHDVADGKVYAGFHDVAVVSLIVSRTRVYKGQPVQINVTVQNKGEYPETFNVTTYYDTNVVGITSVHNLMNGSELSLSFVWDTTDVTPERTYKIKAEAARVPGETNFENNLIVDGNVTVSSPPTFLIRITDVTPCNQSGYPRSSFEAGSIAYFKVTVNNTSFNPESVLVTVNVYDSSNTTLGVVSFKGNLMPGTSRFILGLPIPLSVSSGYARVYANAFTDWPYFGGIPYCPEVSATFEITGP